MGGVGGVGGVGTGTEQACLTMWLYFSFDSHSQPVGFVCLFVCFPQLVRSLTLKVFLSLTQEQVDMQMLNKGRWDFIQS